MSGTLLPVGGRYFPPSNKSAPLASTSPDVRRQHEPASLEPFERISVPASIRSRHPITSAPALRRLRFNKQIQLSFDIFGFHPCVRVCAYTYLAWPPCRASRALRNQCMRYLNIRLSRSVSVSQRSNSREFNQWRI